MQFSVTTLSDLQATGKRYVVSDDTRPGLAIKVSALGSKGFYFRWKEKGKRKEVLLQGSFSEVLSQYEYYYRATHLNQEEEVVKGLPAGTFIKVSLPDLIEAFMKGHVRKNLSKHSEKNYQSFFDRLLSHCKGHPLYHGRGDMSSSRQVIKQLLKKVRDDENHNVLCNRMRSAYSSMFKWGIEEDYLSESPMWGMPSAADSKPKTTHLTDSDLRIWLKVLADGNFNEDTKDALRLILLTGMRSGEVLHLQPFDKNSAGDMHKVIRLDEGILWLPETKNRQEFIVALPQQAISLIELRLAGLGPQSRLFGTRAWGLRQVSRRASERAQTVVVNPHDLRRTFATLAGAKGIDYHIIQRLLNHTTPGVTAKHYALYQYLEEKREACQKIADHLETLGPLLKTAP